MPLDLTRVRALCFDVDGTLSDTDDLYVQKAEKAIPRFLFKEPRRVARRLVMWLEAPGNAMMGLADALHLDDDIYAFINWRTRNRKYPNENFMLIRGVDEMLKRLHGRYPLAVISARDEKGTMRFLERFDLVQYFDVIVSGLSTTYTKPYPDPVLFAAQRMNVAPENCLMIGDTTVDIRAGKAAGAQTVGVLCGFGEESELRRFGADEILADTTQLLKILEAR